MQHLWFSLSEAEYSVVEPLLLFILRLSILLLPMLPLVLILLLLILLLSIFETLLLDSCLVLLDLDRPLIPAQALAIYRPRLFTILDQITTNSLLIARFRRLSGFRCKGRRTEKRQGRWICGRKTVTSTWPLIWFWPETFTPLPGNCPPRPIVLRNHLRIASRKKEKRGGIRSLTSCNLFNTSSRCWSLKDPEILPSRSRIAMTLAARRRCPRRFELQSSHSGLITLLIASLPLEAASAKPPLCGWDSIGSPGFQSMTDKDTARGWFYLIALQRHHLMQHAYRHSVSEPRNVL